MTVRAADDVLQESRIGFRFRVRSANISTCTDWFASGDHLFVVDPDIRAETALASFLSSSTMYSSVRGVSSITDKGQMSALILVQTPHNTAKSHGNHRRVSRAPKE